MRKVIFPAVFLVELTNAFSQPKCCESVLVDYWLKAGIFFFVYFLVKRINFLGITGCVKKMTKF